MEPPSGFEHGTPGKDKATSVKTKDKTTKKHKGQLRMMEDEQNLRKILPKVHWQNCPKRYIKKDLLVYS